MWSDAPGRWLFLRLPGLITAVLALVSQLALGAAVLPAQAAQDVLAATFLDCSSHPAPGHHHDGVSCPLCVAAELPGALLVPPPVLPAPTPLHAIRTATRPEAYGPPGRVTEAAFPRGPPATA